MQTSAPVARDKTRRYGYSPVPRPRDHGQAPRACPRRAASCGRAASGDVLRELDKVLQQKDRELQQLRTKLQKTQERRLEAERERAAALRRLQPGDKADSDPRAAWRPAVKAFDRWLAEPRVQARGRTQERSPPAAARPRELDTQWTSFGTFSRPGPVRPVHPPEERQAHWKKWCRETYPKRRERYQSEVLQRFSPERKRSGSCERQAGKPVNRRGRDECRPRMPRARAGSAPVSARTDGTGGGGLGAWPPAAASAGEAGGAPAAKQDDREALEAWVPPEKRDREPSPASTRTGSSSDKLPDREASPGPSPTPGATPQAERLSPEPEKRALRTTGTER